MSIAMFIVGFVIFTAYVAFLIWNIFHSAKKNREENYPDYYSRHKQPNAKSFNKLYPDNVEIMVGRYPNDLKRKRKPRRSDKRKKIIK